MSKDDIKNKFGEPNGYSITSISGITSEDWSYTSDIKGDTGANFIITFQNDAVWSPVNKIDNLNRDFFVLCHD